MRIIRLTNTPVVLRIRRPDEVTVVVSSDLPTAQVLDMARLVLSDTELAELHDRVAADERIASGSR